MISTLTNLCQGNQIQNPNSNTSVNMFAAQDFMAPSESDSIHNARLP